MEYLKSHSEITFREVQIIKTFIIDNLKIRCEKGVNYSEAKSQIASLIQDNFLNSNIIFSNFSSFESIPYLFSHHSTTYNKNKVDTILSILNNEIKESFDDIKTRNLQNSYFPEIIKNLSFERFCEELLKYSVYIRSKNILRDDSSYLNQLLPIFYDNDNYKDFDTTFIMESTEIKIVGRLLKKYNKIISDNNSPTLINSKPDNTNIINQKSFEINEIISSLNYDEKSLLLHIALDQKNGIDKSEKIQLILLSQSINDHSIFWEKRNNNTLYSKVNKGINYYNSTKNSKKLLENIIKKLEPLVLPKTKEILHSIKINIKST